MCERASAAAASKCASAAASSSRSFSMRPRMQAGRTGALLTPELPEPPEPSAAWAGTDGGPHPGGGAFRGTTVGAARPGTGGGGPASRIAEDTTKVVQASEWFAPYSGAGDAGRGDAGGGDVGRGGRGDSGVPGVGWCSVGASMSFCKTLKGLQKGPPSLTVITASKMLQQFQQTQRGTTSRPVRKSCSRSIVAVFPQEGHSCRACRSMCAERR